MGLPDCDDSSSMRAAGYRRSCSLPCTISRLTRAERVALSYYAQRPGAVRECDKNRIYRLANYGLVNIVFQSDSSRKEMARLSLIGERVIRQKV